jgi:hypothetical protein
MQTPARRIPNPWVANFAEIRPGVLYRGAQPEIPAGITFLAWGIDMAVLGFPRIGTVIDLQGALLDQERAACAQSAVLFDSFILPGIEIVTTPPEATIDLVMATLSEPTLYPIFVHCLHGSDRTGCIIALWRVTHDGWSVADAIEEMRAFGNSWIEMGYRKEIEKYLKEHAQNG